MATDYWFEQLPRGLISTVTRDTQRDILMSLASIKRWAKILGEPDSIFHGLVSISGIHHSLHNLFVVTFQLASPHMTYIILNTLQAEPGAVYTDRPDQVVRAYNTLAQIHDWGTNLEPFPDILVDTCATVVTLPVSTLPPQMITIYRDIDRLVQARGMIVTQPEDWPKPQLLTGLNVSLIGPPVTTKCIMYSNHYTSDELTVLLASIPTPRCYQLSPGRSEYLLLRELLTLAGTQVLYEDKGRVWYHASSDILVLPDIERLVGIYYIHTEDANALYSFLMAYRGRFDAPYNVIGITNSVYVVCYTVDSLQDQQAFLAECAYQEARLNGQKTLVDVTSLAEARAWHLAGASIFVIAPMEDAPGLTIPTPAPKYVIIHDGIAPPVVDRQALLDVLGISHPFNIIQQEHINDIPLEEIASGIGINGYFYRASEVCNLNKDPLTREWLSPQVRLDAQHAPYNHVGTGLVDRAPVGNKKPDEIRYSTASKYQTYVSINRGPRFVFHDIWLENQMIGWLYETGHYLPRSSNVYASRFGKSLNTRPSLTIRRLAFQETYEIKSELEWLRAHWIPVVPNGVQQNQD